MSRNETLTSSDEAAAVADLTRSRAFIQELTAPVSGGVYAIYLCSPRLLAPFPAGEDGLIYVGCSSKLADREFEQHFSSGSTGFSTLRRSIGALLKLELSLRAIPRAPGPSETNLCNYRFTDDVEDRLTEWMHAHLEISVHATPKFNALEDWLVSNLRPLLNLTKWPNPHRVEIKQIRKVCADEARAARAGRVPQQNRSVDLGVVFLWALAKLE